MQNAVAITHGPKSHFFGYYDKFQVDAGGTRAIVLEVDFEGRMPNGSDVAGVCVVDLATGQLGRIGETTAWCWQQGCMAQWLGSAPDRDIIFNVRLGDRFGCRVVDTSTGRARDYDRPIYTPSSDGRFALAPNFSRLDVLRPGYGYPGVDDARLDECAFDDDGIWRLDLETGTSRLILSLAEIVAFCPRDYPPGARHWLNHLLVGPGDRRFVFLHRWEQDGRWLTRMLTAGVDGSELCLLNDHDLTSHFIWRDETTVLAWANRPRTGKGYYVFTDRSGEAQPLAPDQLSCDGHMSYRPQRDWFVTDTYPQGDPPRRRLMLFHEADERLVEVGRFLSPTPIGGNPCRCDLHPRWSRDGRSILFDSVHGGPRQVYRMDVGAVVEP